MTYHLQDEDYTIKRTLYHQSATGLPPQPDTCHITSVTSFVWSYPSWQRRLAPSELWSMITSNDSFQITRSHQPPKQINSATTTIIPAITLAHLQSMKISPHINSMVHQQFPGKHYGIGEFGIVGKVMSASRE